MNTNINNIYSKNLKLHLNAMSINIKHVMCMIALDTVN